jgi:5-(carboxyamino)imidazole ribonucleotide mutase
MDSPPLVAVLMGSRSDWETMRSASEILAQFEIPHECRALSAHRTPEQVTQYIREAEEQGVKVFIAGAGHAAHLAGVVAGQTTRPVLGVPIDSSALLGLDALLATVQMPGGIPVATMAIGRSGAKNAALMAISILATSDAALFEKIVAYREEMTNDVLETSVIDPVR